MSLTLIAQCWDFLAEIPLAQAISPIAIFFSVVWSVIFPSSVTLVHSA